MRSTKRTTSHSLISKRISKYSNLSPSLMISKGVNTRVGPMLWAAHLDPNIKVWTMMMLGPATFNLNWESSFRMQILRRKLGEYWNTILIQITSKKFLSRKSTKEGTMIIIRTQITWYSTREHLTEKKKIAMKTFDYKIYWAFQIGFKLLLYLCYNVSIYTYSTLITNLLMSSLKPHQVLWHFNTWRLCQMP